MNARDVLNAAREGQPVSTEAITQALRETGDLGPPRAWPGYGDSPFDQDWIKTSGWPANIIPAGVIAIDQTSEDGDCTVKGFYDQATGDFHIQEVLYNRPAPPEQTP